MIWGHCRKAKRKEEQSVVEIGVQTQGNLTFKDPVELRINGRFSGTLEFCGTLMTAEFSDIEATIVGDNIVIAGKVKGDITAHKMLVLMPTAVVRGNISTPKLNVVEGAVFQGNCQMIDDLLDIKEVAQYLEIDIKEIDALAHSGKIPGQRRGNIWKFERSQIDQWASSGKVI